MDKKSRLQFKRVYISQIEHSLPQCQSKLPFISRIGLISKQRRLLNQNYKQFKMCPKIYFSRSQNNSSQYDFITNIQTCKHLYLRFDVWSFQHGKEVINYFIKQLKKLPKNIQSISLYTSEKVSLRDRQFRRVVKYLSCLRKLRKINIDCIAIDHRNEAKIYYPQFQHLKYMKNHFSKFLKDLNFLNLMNHFIKAQKQSFFQEYGKSIACIPNLKSITTDSLSMHTDGYYKNFNSLINSLGQKVNNLAITYNFRPLKLTPFNKNILEKLIQIKPQVLNLKLLFQHSINYWESYMAFISVLTPKDSLEIEFSIKFHESCFNYGQKFKEKIQNLKSHLSKLQTKGVKKIHLRFAYPLSYLNIEWNNLEILKLVSNIPCEEQIYYLGYRQFSKQEAILQYLTNKTAKVIKITMQQKTLLFTNYLENNLILNKNLQILDLKIYIQMGGTQENEIWDFWTVLYDKFPNLSTLKYSLDQNLSEPSQRWRFIGDWKVLLKYKVLVLSLPYQYQFYKKDVVNFIHSLREQEQISNFKLSLQLDPLSNNESICFPSYVNSYFFPGNNNQIVIQSKLSNYICE